MCLPRPVDNPLSIAETDIRHCRADPPDRDNYKSRGLKSSAIGQFPIRAGRPRYAGHRLRDGAAFVLGHRLPSRAPMASRSDFHPRYRAFIALSGQGSFLHRTRLGRFRLGRNGEERAADARRWPPLAHFQLWPAFSSCRSPWWRDQPSCAASAGSCSPAGAEEKLPGATSSRAAVIIALALRDRRRGPHHHRDATGSSGDLGLCHRRVVVCGPFGMLLRLWQITRCGRSP